MCAKNPGKGQRLLDGLLELRTFVLALPVLVCFLLALFMFVQFLRGDCPLLDGLDFSIHAAGLILIGFCPSFHDHV